VIDSKGRDSGLFWAQRAPVTASKRKAGASSGTPNSVTYKIKYT
jgi:hypothetical protein